MISRDLSRRSFLMTAAASTVAATLPIEQTLAQNPSQAPSFEAGAIKVLAFDFQGSCVDYFTPLMEAGRRINADKNLDLDWGAMTKEWRDCYHDVMEPVLAHKRDYVPTEQVYREGLDALLDKHGLSGRFSKQERDELNNVWGQMIPWPDTKEGLSRLSKKFALTTLSNAGMKTVFQMVHRHQLPFDEVLTGELARNYKPAPEVYELVLSMLGYRKEEVLFCATHFYDLKDAKKFGYKTAWWPRPLENGPGKPIDTETKPFVDLHVADIVGLAASLGA
jgi:2-haloacid dehalogenase